MQPERNHESAIAQQRLEALGQLLRGVGRVSRLQHHLFDVVSKAFAGAVGPEELSGRRCGVPLVQALDVMAGIGLVD